tara:strand:- start:1050 stop:1286 length:237 start_codon:yes stop_codon:yes gene_type:complete
MDDMNGQRVTDMVAHAYCGGHQFTIDRVGKGEMWTEMGPKSLARRLIDRNGDGVPERVRVMYGPPIVKGQYELEGSVQ